MVFSMNYTIPYRIPQKCKYIYPAPFFATHYL
jgi:hypothetical protein